MSDDDGTILSDLGALADVDYHSQMSKPKNLLQQTTFLSTPASEKVVPTSCIQLLSLTAVDPIYIGMSKGVVAMTIRQSLWHGAHDGIYGLVH